MNKCKFCNGDGLEDIIQYKIPLFNNPNMELEAELEYVYKPIDEEHDAGWCDNRNPCLGIVISDFEGIVIASKYIDIKYCPMCGRRLEK